MNSDKFFSLLTVTVLVSLLSACDVSSTENKKITLGCTKISEIIDDSTKMKYFSGWVGQKLGDVGFVKLFERNNEIFSLSRPTEFSKSDVDWGKVGINSEIAYLSVIKDDLSNIVAVGAGEGRNGFLMSFGEEAKKFVADENIVSRTIQLEGKDIYLICRSD